MQTIGTASRVKIYIGESDRLGHKPLWSAILELLRQEDCAGATVTRGLAGFGAASRIHAASIVALSEDLPLVIEWVDDPDRVARLLPRITEMVADGLVTLESVEVVTYSQRRVRELRAAAPVADIMHREVRSVTPDTRLDRAVELLIRRNYRALPVVDAEGRLVGILTDGDLLRRANLMPGTAQQAMPESELRARLNALAATGQSVGDVMTPGPVTVTPETTVGAAVRLMSERNVKRLPVVDASGRLSGIVSRVDVLRALAQPPMRDAGHELPPPGRHVTVGEIMMKEVPTVPAGAPLSTVVDRLVRTARRRVIVVDGQRRVLGIITDADLLRRAAEPERADLLAALADRAPLPGEAAVRLGRRTAADVMTRDPITVRPETPLSEALQLLLAHRIKRLPVVDPDGHLLGMVGRGGILASLAREVGKDES